MKKPLAIISLLFFISACEPSCYETYEDAWAACNAKYNNKCKYLGEKYKVCDAPPNEKNPVREESEKHIERVPIYKSNDVFHLDPPIGFEIKNNAPNVLSEYNGVKDGHYEFVTNMPKKTNTPSYQSAIDTALQTIHDNKNTVTYLPIKNYMLKNVPRDYLSLPVGKNIYVFRYNGIEYSIDLNNVSLIITKDPSFNRIAVWTEIKPDNVYVHASVFECVDDRFFNVYTNHVNLANVEKNVIHNVADMAHIEYIRYNTSPAYNRLLSVVCRSIGVNGRFYTYKENMADIQMD